MVCVEHENLRQRWIAARADYQLALADLQVTFDASEFRSALRRANEAFSDYNEAEAALNDHLRQHGCARIPIFGPLSRPVQAA